MRDADRAFTTSCVVFDFDHTLTPRDCSAQFFRWLLRCESWRMVALLPLVLTLGPLMAHRRTRRYPVRVAVWLATWRRALDTMPMWIERHLDHRVESGQSLLLGDGRRQLQAHLDRGDRVVIATGALQELVEAILRREGLATVEVVGSSVRRFLGGWVADQYCYGPRKPRMLRARGWPEHYDAVYSDHSDDLPLFERGAQRYAINPRPACVERLRAALGDDWTLLQWR